MTHPRTDHVRIAAAMRTLTPAQRAVIHDALALPDPLNPDAPYGSLLAQGRTHTDAALALLRQSPDRVPGARRAAQAILGLPVTACPPHVPRWPPLPVRKPARPLEPTVRWVRADNPRLPGTGAHRRFALIRAGLPRSALLARGVTVRDLRELAAGGHLVMTGPLKSSKGRAAEFVAIIGAPAPSDDAPAGEV